MFQEFVRIRYFLVLYFYSLIALFVEFYYSHKRKLVHEPLLGTTNVHDLSTCVCLINGAANGSIGRMAIKKLAQRNFSLMIITLHGDPGMVEKTKINLINNELDGLDPSRYRFEYLDMTSFSSIVRLVKKLNDSSQKINFFLSNPGIALKEITVTDDQFDSQLQINYLSGCLLLIGLLPLLVKTAKLAEQMKEPKSKIVFTSSNSHKMVQCDLDQLDKVSEHFKSNFSTHKMYPSTKLFQLMFNLEFFEQIIKRNGLNSIIGLINVHPGIIDSGLYNNSTFKNKYSFLYKILALIMKTAEVGAINVTAPVISNDTFFDSTSSLYLEDLQISSMNRACYDKELRIKLYERTLCLLRVNIEQFDLPRHLNPLIKL